jgi:hypothetical protein
MDALQEITRCDAIQQGQAMHAGVASAWVTLCGLE